LTTPTLNVKNVFDKNPTLGFSDIKLFLCWLHKRECLSMESLSTPV
jgi:hypothetical protein